MSPTMDLLFHLLMGAVFLAMVVSVVLGRRLTDRAAAAEAGHDPYQCRDCAPLRHPCNQDLRKALESLPRQTRGGGQ
ncbi:hypothetical protein [Streptomyces alfalfae]